MYKLGRIVLANEKTVLSMEFLKVRKKYWLIPIIIALFVLSIITVVTEETVVAPYVYAIF